jgi:DNA-binding NarL/FixJ family response regulator
MQTRPLGFVCRELAARPVRTLFALRVVVVVPRRSDLRDERPGSCTMKRLLIVHRFPIVRYGLTKLVEEYVQGVAVSEAGAVMQALECVRDADWDLVVMGLSFGRTGGLELLKAIKDLRPHLSVIVFSTHAEELYARRSFAAGAAGYVTKDSSRAELAHAIRNVLSGGCYMSTPLAETGVVDIKSPRGNRGRRVLSDREYEVMRLLAAGHTVDEIAGRLSVNARTISTYRARLLRKLAMSNGAQQMRCRSENTLIE